MNLRRTVNHFFDFPDLVQKFRQSRTNYDYQTRSLTSLVDSWFILETFVYPVKTKNGDRLMMIISELSDPGNPNSLPTGIKYKVFSSSRCINDFLIGLRETKDELRALPMIIKVISIPYTDRKSGKIKTRFEFDCGL